MVLKRTSSFSILQMMEFNCSIKQNQDLMILQGNMNLTKNKKTWKLILNEVKHKCLAKEILKVSKQVLETYTHVT